MRENFEALIFIQVEIKVAAMIARPLAPYIIDVLYDPLV